MKDILQIIIPEKEYYDENKQEFINTKSVTIQLEHSLISLSKWESKWRKPFLSKDNKTIEETIDYIRCMTINQNVSDEVYDNIPSSILCQILEYIEAPMTATKINEPPGTKKNRAIITSEVIYHSMFSQNIPMECQKWHLNRLLTLINVCSIKNGPQKTMGKRQMLEERKTLNDIRRNQYNSKG